MNHSITARASSTLRHRKAILSKIKQTIQVCLGSDAGFPYNSPDPTRHLCVSLVSSNLPVPWLPVNIPAQKAISGPAILWLVMFWTVDPIKAWKLVRLSSPTLQSPWSRRVAECRGWPESQTSTPAAQNKVKESRVAYLEHWSVFNQIWYGF